MKTSPESDITTERLKKQNHCNYNEQSVSTCACGADVDFYLKVRVLCQRQSHHTLVLIQWVEGSRALTLTMQQSPLVEALAVALPEF